MIKISVNGCCGRMGTFISEFVMADADTKLVGGLERKGHPSVGKPFSPVCEELIVSDNASKVIEEADVFIDFSQPDVTMEYLQIAKEAGTAVVIGTTGLSDEQKNQIEETAQTIPVVFSPNMSMGVNVLFQLVKEVAAKLKGYETEIVELHHHHKKDAPSGTAIKLAEIIADERGLTLAKDGVFGREGAVGARKPDEIGVMAVRAGDIVGEHTVYFVTEGERIELTHKAHSRKAFAQGAVAAAKFLSGKKSGLYNMEDVLFVDGE